MGKHTNAKGLRLFKTKNWHSQFYSDPFNYSNLTSQDLIIRDYVTNMLLKFKIQTVQVNIKRHNQNVCVYIKSYNDHSTFSEAFLNFYSQQIRLKNKILSSNLYEKSNSFSDDFLNHIFYKEPNFTDKVLFGLPQNNTLNNLQLSGQKKLRYSLKRVLALNLAYFLKTNVIIKNTNIIKKSPALIKLFWSLAYKLRSPLPSHLSLKFICLVYHSILHKSSFLLCRQLAILIPRFCKKQRKSRKMIPFFHFFKRLIKTLFSNGFFEQKEVKGIKVSVKGRLNGARRKGKYVLEYGQTSVQTLKDKVSYHQEDSFTIFGVLGIKVWIIY
jgi:hypothetical protein